MPGKYVPPHLRTGYVAPAPVLTIPVKPRGVHFRSNITGMRTHNEQWRRHKTPTRSPTAAEKKRLKYNLSKRVLRKTARKSALKGKRQTKRQTRSQSPRKTKKEETRRRRSV